MSETTSNPGSGEGQVSAESSEMSESSSFEEGSDSSEEFSSNESIEEQLSDQPGDSEEVKEAKAELRRKFKIKVDGEELEEEIDLSDEEAIIRKLQLAAVAQKRMQEKALYEKKYGQLDKDIRSFFEILKNNPREILEDPNLNIDLKQLAEQILNEEIEEAQKMLRKN